MQQTDFSLQISWFISSLQTTKCQILECLSSVLPEGREVFYSCRKTCNICFKAHLDTWTTIWTLEFHLPLLKDITYHLPLSQWILGKILYFLSCSNIFCANQRCNSSDSPCLLFNYTVISLGRVTRWHFVMKKKIR